MILDGWGLAKDTSVSAIDKANTPFVDGLYDTYSHSRLEASGLAVGLPAGQMGNSEVGHMNIGAGRVVYQDLVKINKAVEDGTMAQNGTLLGALHYAISNNKAVHLIGLVSDGGVHSHISHLLGLMHICGQMGINNAFVHAFTDGRDTDPKSGKGFVEEVIKAGKDTGVQLASVTGRYYAMDRDKRWERVKLAYDAMVNGVGETSTDALGSIEASYAEGVTDEFLKPIILRKEGMPLGTINEGDVVICFNFRTDRGRQITEALTQMDIPDAGMKKLDLNYITMTNYDETFEGIHVMYDKDNLSMTLGEVLANANKKSEIMKGEGDGERNKIFANAFGRDPQFFAFYRAMQAYEKALIGGETSLVLSPDSDFFKFFGKSIKPAVKR